jgi:hypothetical protein
MEPQYVSRKKNFQLHATPKGSNKELFPVLTTPPNVAVNAIYLFHLITLKITGEMASTLQCYKSQHPPIRRFEPKNEQNWPKTAQI